LAEKHRKDT